MISLSIPSLLLPSYDYEGAVFRAVPDFSGHYWALGLPIQLLNG